jgi:hypothetical protein
MMSGCHVLQNLVADLQNILTDTKCEIEIIEPHLLLEYTGIIKKFNAMRKFYDALFLAGNVKKIIFNPKMYDVYHFIKIKLHKIPSLLIILKA